MICSSRYLTSDSGLVFSALRFWVTYSINHSTDQTYVSARLLVWSELEAGFYLISACLLIMRPLIEHIADSSLIQSLRSNIYGNRSTGRGSGNGSKNYATGEGSYPTSMAGGAEAHSNADDSEGSTQKRKYLKPKYGGSRDDIEMVNGLHFTSSR